MTSAGPGAAVKVLVKLRDQLGDSKARTRSPRKYGLWLYWSSKAISIAGETFGRGSCALFPLSSIVENLLTDKLLYALCFDSRRVLPVTFTTDSFPYHLRITFADEKYRRIFGLELDFQGDKILNILRFQKGKFFARMCWTLWPKGPKLQPQESKSLTVLRFYADLFQNYCL